MSDTPRRSVFRFESPGLAVEFEGPESFVEAQIERFRDRIREELERARRGGTQPSPDAEAAADMPSDDGPPSLTDFYQRTRSREGRGALQETILIFAYYLQHVRGQGELSIGQISSCFEETGATAPSSLANTMGMMRRSQGFFDAGRRRGRYVLTDEGTSYVRRLIGARPLS